MDIYRNIGAAMAVATVAVPAEVAAIMAAVNLSLLEMAVKTAHGAAGHDDIIHRGITLRHRIQRAIPGVDGPS